MNRFFIFLTFLQLHRRELIGAALLLLLAILASVFTSCGDKDPVPTIEGRWSAMQPLHPDWVYDFRNGILTQSIYIGNTNVTTHSYVYSQRGDTIYIGGDRNTDPRTWVVQFESWNILHVQPQNVKINNLQYLRRIE